jgi:hypothetical protein
VTQKAAGTPVAVPTPRELVVSVAQRRVPSSPDASNDPRDPNHRRLPVRWAVILGIALPTGVETGLHAGLAAGIAAGASCAVALHAILD